MMSRTVPYIVIVILVLSALVVPSAVATDGPKVQATVSFGQWQTDPPLDRFTNPNDRTRNNHQLLPQVVQIKAGGAVNFIISGFHEPVIYGDGTQPGDINTNLVVPPPPVALIDDPANRMFRGIDPRPLSQDRVESVIFRKSGTYLVICGVQPHFVNDGMFGFVKVTGPDAD